LDCITELSSATIHQFPIPDRRRQHATEVFAFNRDVRADPDLAASVKVVSAAIAETFVDHRTGVAIVGADDIARACGCSPATVKAAVNVLAATYWHVQRGSQGSGHANHYRKRQPADYSKVSGLTFPTKAKRANPRKEKGQSTSIKGQPADMNLYTSTSEQSGAHAPRSVLGDSLDVTDRDGAYRRLCQIYPLAPDIGCREVFDQLLNAGVDIDDILDAAADMAGRMETQGPRPMINFLRYMLENHQ
jgi:hypothetical protein